jgi:hypothetical protein
VSFIIYRREKGIVNAFDNYFISDGLHQKRKKLSKFIIHCFIFFQLLSYLFCLSGFFLYLLKGGFRDFFGTSSSDFTTFDGSQHFFSHEFDKIKE